MSPEASYIDFWCKSMTRFYMHCDAGVKWLNVYQTTLSVEIRCFECLRTWVFEGKTGDKTLYSRINLETNFWKFLRIFRSSGTVVFRKKGILKNFTKKGVSFLKKFQAEACNHCMESVEILSFLWPVFSRIRTEFGKIRTRKNSIFWHFSSGEPYKKEALAHVFYCEIRKIFKNTIV